MSSWFNIESLKGLAEKVNAESFKEFTDKVQSALPKIDDGFLEKLTLNSPELTDERRRIDNEECAKEKLRNSLAGLLPWETRDPDRDILVEECRDAILKLSRDHGTFAGPYPMPTTKSAAAENEQNSDSQRNEKLKESKEKLEKLEPLPPRLRDFNLDAHVGLIERLLKEDPNLVKMQMSLSAGGERERTFWRNYFFHCAFTRYEAGLSIDEIWSDEPPVFTVPIPTELLGENEEETITFQSAESVNDKDDSTSKEVQIETQAMESLIPVDMTLGRHDFEMIGETEGGNTASNDCDDDDDLGDYELDELEAEIARELED